MPAELIKEGGETAVTKLHQIRRALWEMGDWPEDWTNSIFVSIPKKGNTKQRTNNRMVALVSHASKAILKIVQERNRNRNTRGASRVSTGERYQRPDHRSTNCHA